MECCFLRKRVGLAHLVPKPQSSNFVLVRNAKLKLRDLPEATGLNQMSKQSISRGKKESTTKNIESKSFLFFFFCFVWLLFSSVDANEIPGSIKRGGGVFFFNRPVFKWQLEFLPIWNSICQSSFSFLPDASTTQKNYKFRIPFPFVKRKNITVFTLLSQGYPEWLETMDRDSCTTIFYFALFFFLPLEQ